MKKRTTLTNEVKHYHIEVNGENVFREGLCLRGICIATCDDCLIHPCIAVKCFVGWVLVFFDYS